LRSCSQRRGWLALGWRPCTLPGTSDIAVAIQSSWKQLGLDVTIKSMEWKQYLAFLGPPPSDDVDVYGLGWTADYPDAYTFLSLWTCNSGNNNTNWVQREIRRHHRAGGQDDEYSQAHRPLPPGRKHPRRPEGCIADHADPLVHLLRAGEAVRPRLLDQPNGPGPL
jgi:hypothetical protein